MNGFVKIRRGIAEHLRDGTISIFVFGIYVILHLQADYRTGVWTGSAPRLAAAAPRGVRMRDVQRALRRLVEIFFIRVFRRQGKRGNYRVLIHKFEPNTPALRGKRLNAFKSTSWRDLVFEDCADDRTENGTENGTDTVADAAPYQEEEVKEEREKGKNPNTLAGNGSRVRAVKTTPDPLFAKFWADYPRKIRRKEAEASWRRLSEAERLAAVEALSAFIASDAWQEQAGKFIPAPDRFLREGRWKTLPSKGKNNANANRKPTNAVNSRRGTDFSAGRTVLHEL